MEAKADIERLVRFLVTSLVDYPDDVVITENRDGDRTVYEVQTHADDVGKVIGRQGRVIKAIRTLVRAAASADGGSDATVEVLG